MKPFLEFNNLYKSSRTQYVDYDDIGSYLVYFKDGKLFEFVRSFDMHYNKTYSVYERYFENFVGVFESSDPKSAFSFFLSEIKKYNDYLDKSTHENILTDLKELVNKYDTNNNEELIKQIKSIKTRLEDCSTALENIKHDVNKLEKKL